MPKTQSVVPPGHTSPERCDADHNKASAHRLISGGTARRRVVAAATGRDRCPTAPDGDDCYSGTCCTELSFTSYSLRRDRTLSALDDVDEMTVSSAERGRRNSEPRTAETHPGPAPPARPEWWVVASRARERSRDPANAPEEDETVDEDDRERQE